MAKERDLDLVVVSANQAPPVAKILDWGKYKYETEKRAKEAKKKQHTVDIKEVKMRYKIDVHDYEVRLKAAKKFLASGNKVKVVIAVGAMPYSKDYLNTLKDANNIKLPFFYLRGGIDYSKLNFFFRKFLPVIGKDIARDDKELLNLFKYGGDFVTKDNLNEVLNYLK